MQMMKRMKFGIGLVLAAATLCAMPAMAQAAAGKDFASVHGHINNAAGVPVKGCTVQMTKNLTGDMKDRVWSYKFPADDNGDYKGGGILPGEYSLMVTADGKNLDLIEKVKFEIGQDVAVNFDMTRKEYMDKMTPEDKAALEEYKKHVGETMNANKVVANLNATLARVRADLATAGKPKYDDVSKDISDMKDAVTAKPDESILWLTYGDTLQAQANHLAKQDKADHKPVTGDDAAMKLFNDGIDAYKKSVELNAAAKAPKKPSPLEQATAYNQIGNSYATMGKIPEATEAFENAVKLMPANAGMYYYNEAAVLFNASNSGSDTIEAAAAAADKAIAADPAKAEPYYIKGQALIQKVTADKDGKIIAPPGMYEAYQKYLELTTQPDGTTALEVKQILTSMGQPITTKYKAGKK